MKLKFFVVMVIMLLSANTVRAEYGPEEKRLGLGFYLGEPLGITAKYYLTEVMSIQGVGSWSFFDEGLTLISDVLFDVHDLASSQQNYALPIYVGVGAKFVIQNQNAHDDSTFGAHVPVGLAWQSLNTPLEIAFEVAPGMDLSPKAKFDVNGGIIFRYYF